MTLALLVYTFVGIVIEQRKHQRFDLQLPFELVRSKENSRVVGETKNVSSTGVLFTSPAPMEVGESIEYLITLPKAKGSRTDVHLRCVGKVLRGDGPSAFAATLERYEFLRA